MIPVLQGKRVVLGVSGSIAAYKAVSLASALHQAGATVDVAMTAEATELVRPLTFQAITHRQVAVDMFSLLSETEIGHVSLGVNADLIVIAPATAHTLAKLALGLADDMLCTTVLASTAPIIVAPAMDANMFQHSSVREHLDALRGRGCIVLEPGIGHLASGLVGQGRLAEPEIIFDAVRAVLGRGGDLAGWEVVVTAGGTQEPIDPVRYVSNRSSGKMGYALAEAARDRGARVTLISANTALSDPWGVEVRPVRTAQEMCEQVLARWPDVDALIMAAAVADYRPESRAEQKIKKQGEGLALRLEPTVDILAATTNAKSRALRVGFAAESERLLEHAREKLVKKRLDLIVANDITLPGSGFGADENQVTMLSRDGQERELPLMPKLQVAYAVLDEVRRLRQ
jgi:phosphopantothenoylcysteine decarboxylase/phosphopantothenate--cysteine ligase